MKFVVSLSTETVHSTYSFWRILVCLFWFDSTRKAGIYGWMKKKLFILEHFNYTIYALRGQIKIRLCVLSVFPYYSKTFAVPFIENSHPLIYFVCRTFHSRMRDRKTIFHFRENLRWIRRGYKYCWHRRAFAQTNTYTLHRQKLLQNSFPLLSRPFF